MIISPLTAISPKVLCGRFCFVVGSTMALMTKLGFPMAAYKGDILGVSVGDINDTLYALRKDTEHYKNEDGIPQEEVAIRKFLQKYL